MGLGRSRRNILVEMVVQKGDLPGKGRSAETRFSWKTAMWRGDIMWNETGAETRQS
jgi:hypothetical protein